MKTFFQDWWSFLKGLNQQSVVAVMATIVSICALVVSLYQAQLSRQQQLAAVWPYVSIGGYGTANGEKQTWGITVSNNGLGPAIIESVTVVYKGKSYAFPTFADTLYAHNAQLDALKNLNYSLLELKPGEVISAGTELTWFSFDLAFTEKPVLQPVSVKFLDQITLTIFYKSLYGERWKSCFNCPGKGEIVQKL